MDRMQLSTRDKIHPFIDELERDFSAIQRASSNRFSSPLMIRVRSHAEKAIVMKQITPMTAAQH